MNPARTFTLLASVALLVVVGVAPAAAQITTATVAGTVHDTSNASIPGATVTLTSATKGVTTETQTSAEGDFVFPTVAADTYTLKVTLAGFKTLERPNIVVHAGDKIALGAWTVPDDFEPGGTNGTAYLATCPKFDQDAFATFRDELRFRGPERFPPDSLQPGRS